MEVAVMRETCLICMITLPHTAYGKDCMFTRERECAKFSGVSVVVFCYVTLVDQCWEAGVPDIWLFFYLLIFKHISKAVFS